MPSASASTSTSLLSPLVPVISPMLSASRLQFFLSLFLLFLLRLLPLLSFLLLLTLQILPFLYEHLSLLLECLFVKARVKGDRIIPLCFQFSLELLDIRFAACLMRIGGPLFKTGDVEGQLFFSDVVLIWK